MTHFGRNIGCHGQREYPADLVLVAVGVNPNTQLAKQAGLEIGETGAIRVDASMRTSDPSIYAGGDCVENVSIITGAIFAPMGSTAIKHGRAVIISAASVPDSKGFAVRPQMPGFSISMWPEQALRKTGQGDGV